MKGNFIVYIIINPKGSKYIGISSDIEKRLSDHNEGTSTYTKNKGPWTFYWLSSSMTHTEALILEKLMKKQKGGKGLLRIIDAYSRL